MIIKRLEIIKFCKISKQLKFRYQFGGVIEVLSIEAVQGCVVFNVHI